MPERKNRRQLHAAETRRSIIEAATRLFAEQGYHETSIAQIARAAHVAPQTIYNSVGAKGEVLSSALDYAVAGDRAPTPVPVFMQQQAASARDGSEVIAQLVAFWRTALPRLVPMLRVLGEAASSDPQIAELEAERNSRRLNNYRTAASQIAERGGLATSVDGAAATIFAIGHPEVFRTLVLDGAWTLDEWANWVTRMLEKALLPDFVA